MNKKLRKAFIESLYETLDKVISPTPYLLLIEGDNFDIKFLNGKSILPKEKSTEITILDLITASLFFDDFHLLFEGMTGVGKTYTAEAVFNAIFGNDYYTIRLSGGIIGNSAIHPFTTTELINGLPVTRVDQEKCSKYGGLFIDEINRGDPQEVFQVIDGVININGEKGYLRIPIPGTNRYKKLTIVAAMNPPDAYHNAAIELDIAGENRFIKLKFPNGVIEAPSSQLNKHLPEDLHENFWTKFKNKTKLEGVWRDTYPIITDPEHLKYLVLDDTCKEFIDVSLGYIAVNPKETYERNNEIIKNCGLNLSFSVPEGNELEKILELQSNLKYDLVRRDLKKIYNLSKIISFIKSVKNNTYDPHISLNDVAASIGITLKSKTMENDGIMALVREAKNTYETLRKNLNTPEPYGIRNAIFSAAVYRGIDNGFDEYIETIDYNIKNLSKSASNISDAVIKSRLIADLCILKAFSNNYKTKLEKALTRKDPFKSFANLYKKEKNKASIYTRLEFLFEG